MMKLALLVGITACVGFAPTGLGAKKLDRDLNPSEDFDAEFLHVLKRWYPDETPVKIISQSFGENSRERTFSSVTFRNSRDEVYTLKWKDDGHGTSQPSLIARTRKS
ncbi:hypothetical protein GE061_002811 [Apolygus lucorum]|uniref:Uncharacterized protein n=1 Tax=Apolygus lucorum TaxID=248454 RepID=A0A6A4J725_APOLU|nr:hypothetical protein GE061_002811 [Apolygus lucorum]